MNQHEFELRGAIVTATRAHAVDRDATAGTPFELRRLWHRLCAADWRVHDAFGSSDRLYAIVRETERCDGRRWKAGGLAMIEQVLDGQSSKAVAIDRNLSQSAVACAMRIALDRIGLKCRVRSVPHILVMAVRAERDTRARTVLGRISLLQDGPGRFWIVSAERPELALLDALTASEREVMTGLLEGRSYKEISQLRGTSTRTIANQIAVGFRKLHASGRGEVLARLMGVEACPESGGPPASRLGNAQFGSRAVPTTSGGSGASNGFSQSGLGRAGTTLGRGDADRAGSGMSAGAGASAVRFGIPRSLEGSRTGASRVA